MTTRLLRRLRRPAAAVAAVVVLTALTSCSSLDKLQFVQDNSLTIKAPKNLSTVALPFDVAWSLADGHDGSQRYAVFLDRYPMAPGKDVRSVVEQDANCRGTDLCLGDDYLARVYGIYVTDDASITVQSLPVRSASLGGGAHYATVVPVDDAWNRQGESVWFISFQVTV